MKIALAASLALLSGCIANGSKWDNNATVLVLGDPDPAKPDKFDRLVIDMTSESEQNGYAFVEERRRSIMATPAMLTLVIKQNFRDAGRVCAIVTAMDGDVIDSTAECCAGTEGGWYGQCYATLTHHP